MSEPTHWTVWEDDQIAGYRCPADPTHRLRTIAAEDGARPCEGCGTMIRLVWLVYIEDVTDPQQRNTTDVRNG
jgi:hypothetical protein